MESRFATREPLGDSGIPELPQTGELRPKRSMSKPPRKWARVLKTLYDGRSLNRFEAEHVCADHALNTTISLLGRKGVTIERAEEVVPGFQRIPTRCCRYWLAPASYDKARELLGLRSQDAPAPSFPDERPRTYPDV